MLMIRPRSARNYNRRLMHCFNKRLVLIGLLVTNLLLANSTYYGDQYLREKNYYEALKHYQLAWKETPDNLTLKNKIELSLLLIDADAFFEKGDYQQAKNSLQLINSDYGQRGLLNKIEQIENLYLQTAVAIADLRFESAAILLGEIIVHNPADQNAINLKQLQTENTLLKNDYQQAMLLGNYQLAKEKATNLYAQYPSCPKLLSYLESITRLQNAAELTLANKFSEAKQIYREVSLSLPFLQEKLAKKIKETDQLFYLETLGDFYFKENQLTKALETYQHLLNLMVNNKTLTKKIASVQKFNNNFLNITFQLKKQNYLLALKHLQENKTINADNLINNEYLMVVQIIVKQQKEHNKQFSNAALANLSWSEQKELALKTAFNEDPQQKEIYITQEIINSRQQGLIAFELKKYREAQADFANVLIYSPNDKIALLYYKKASEFIN